MREGVVWTALVTSSEKERIICACNCHLRICTDDFLNYRGILRKGLVSRVNKEVDQMRLEAKAKEQQVPETGLVHRTTGDHAPDFPA